MNEERGIVAGLGEVGHALLHVLEEFHVVEGHDPSKGVFANGGTVHILHVCFPYSDTFIDDVKRYQELFMPMYTVIHSTVPIGISRTLNAVHSPIRGQHPNLEGGIMAFVKFLGGEHAGSVANYFRRAGIKVLICDKQETTEAMKLFDTEYYRACIEFTQRVKKYCDFHNLNFHEVYTLANQTYNEGYEALGFSEYVRPVLQPILGQIGGHCVGPNKEFIAKSEK